MNLVIWQCNNMAILYFNSWVISLWSISKRTALTYWKAFIDCSHSSQTEPREGGGEVWLAELSVCRHWCTGWRRGTPCPLARWWMRRGDSYCLHCRRTTSSHRSLRKPRASEGKSWAAVWSMAECQRNTRSHCGAAGSSSRSPGSAWSANACLRPRRLRPGPTWVCTPLLPPSSAGLTGSPGQPEC